MNDREQNLDNLIWKWMQAKSAGESVSPEAVCQHHPDLQIEFCNRIAILNAMHWLNADEIPITGIALQSESSHLQIDGNLDRSESLFTPINPATNAFELVRDTARLECLNPHDLLRLQESLSSDDQNATVSDVLSAMVAEKRLTEFQVSCLKRGQGQALILGNYLLLDKVGEGGMGQVFKAIHRRMKRVVAIKLLSPKSLNSPVAIEQFHQEIEVLAKLEHPNIVPAYDADESQGKHFLAMQYIEGIDLARLVREQGPLSVPQAIQILIQVARGLICAHASGVVHRDIKPANLLIEQDGTVRILDLGLAHISRPEMSAATSPVAPMGTIDYMAPEQATAIADADPRSDIYSLGCTLHFLLTGRPPYSGPHQLDRLRSHRDDPVPDLADLISEVPTELSEIYKKMMAKRLADRYSSMNEVLSDIENFAKGVCDENGIDRRWNREKPFAFPSAFKSVRLLAMVSILIVLAGYAAVHLKNRATSVPHQTQTDLTTDTIPSRTATGDSRPDPTPLTKPPATMEDRALAEWAIEQGASVEVFAGETYLQIIAKEPLPAGPIRLQAIEFHEGEDAVITAADLRRMAGLKSLITLGLYDTEVAPDAWPELSQLVGLEQLSLGRTAVSNDSLRHVSQLPSLLHLRVGETKISDQGLSQLSGMPGLRQLDIQATLVTPAGVEELHRSLPNCRIYSPHGVIHPTATP